MYLLVLCSCFLVFPCVLLVIVLPISYLLCLLVTVWLSSTLLTVCLLWSSQYDCLVFFTLFLVGHPSWLVSFCLFGSSLVTSFIVISCYVHVLVRVRLFVPVYACLVWFGLPSWLVSFHFVWLFIVLFGLVLFGHALSSLVTSMSLHGSFFGLCLVLCCLVLCCLVVGSVWNHVR